MRPRCVVNVWDLPGEKRPRFSNTPGIGATVRHPSDATGLTLMGVHLRVIEPGMAGTQRHFHELEEEWGFVVSGRGAVRIGPHRLPVRPGSFAGFPPGPRPHHFAAVGDEPLVLLEGGERRPKEDRGCWVDLPQWWQDAKPIEPPGPLPPEAGDASQLVHFEDIAEREFRHDVDPRAWRLMRRLDRPTGLQRQAVVWSRVDAGSLSTAFHRHERTDEWIFILDGRAVARVGSERFEVGRHDFLGHPAGGEPHVLEPLEPLIYLMGGTRDAADVVVYPDAGVRRIGDRLEPI